MQAGYLLKISQGFSHASKMPALMLKMYVGWALQMALVPLRAEQTYYVPRALTAESTAECITTAIHVLFIANLEVHINFPQDSSMGQSPWLYVLENQDANSNTYITGSVLPGLHTAEAVSR
jgi:hypothetical protein